ncbi:MAG: hypothetical protein L0H64_02805 [Pseudonocardia sp.]|nr:hypothetical protein [Pseudonocardia sp.]
MTTGVTLDAGALIAIERGTDRARALVTRIRDRRLPVLVPAAALAQAWRGGARQARLAAFLAARGGPEVFVLDAVGARAAGELCARAGTNDVVDASVVLCGLRHDHLVATSDPADLTRLDARVRLFVV